LKPFRITQAFFTVWLSVKIETQMSKKILIVDDEPKIVEICSDYLKAANFDVVGAQDGRIGLEKFQREKPDLVILDLMLPSMDGLDVCREIRKVSTTPIIMLTARVEESDKLVGLELGADDYITKPFSPRELVARVRTVLRRVQGDTSMDMIRSGEIVLDRSRFIVTLGQREIILTPTEFEILATLASQPGRIFTRSQLLMSVRGVAFESYERAIDSHIRNLRKKLNLTGEEMDPIVTVHGVGYKFSGS
jgi:DNA-binding response OmpR family regulator